MKFEELPEQLQAVISPIELESKYVQFLSDIWDGKDEDGRIEMVELFGSKRFSDLEAITESFFSLGA